MRAKRSWYDDGPVTWAEKRKAVDDHYAFHHPERYLIENLRKVLASAEELIRELKKQGHPDSALIVLRSRAAMIEDQINELSALLT
jgi:hypothetical protein